MPWPVVAALLAAAPAADLHREAGRLAAPRFADREAAARRLLLAGPRAVAPLTHAAKSADPEARRRAGALLARLESERLGTATLVTLRLDRVTPATAAAAIARQAGYPVLFHDGPPAGPAVTLHRDRVPFWAAVDALCDAAGLSAQVPDDGPLTLFANDTADPWVCYSGPFRVTATGIHSGQHRPLAGLPRRGLPAGGPEPLNLSLAVLAEAKAPLLGMGQPELFAADDEHGRSLKPPADAGRASYSPPGVGHRSLTHGASLDLQRADRRSTTLRVLRGVVPVAVLAEAVPDITLADPLAGKGRTAVGRTATVTVAGATEADGLLTIELSVTRAAGGGDDDGWQHGVAQRLELLDAAGKPWGFAGVATQTGTANGVTLGVQYRLPAPGARPARLTLADWRTVTREVGFEFHDVPLP